MSVVDMTKFMNDYYEKSKDDYLRCVQLHKDGKVSDLRIAYLQGIYDGVERAWRQFVIANETDSDRCECHERDGSYVCEWCYKKGLRGHMQSGGGE
jgi:hypothetical protein